jgi:hypothetical protein
MMTRIIGGILLLRKLQSALYETYGYALTNISYLVAANEWSFTPSQE